MATAVAVIAAFLVVIAEAAAPPPSTGGCTDELIWFSPCLSYVSSPPNNLTESASGKCCEAFSGGVESLCFCYLVREPNILGFPINTTRLLSLSSLCPSFPQQETSSFNFLCSASPALPPLNGAATHITFGGLRGGGGRGGARASRGRGRDGGRESSQSRRGGGGGSYGGMAGRGGKDAVSPSNGLLLSQLIVTLSLLYLYTL